MGEQTIEVLRRILVQDLFVEMDGAEINPDDGLQTKVGLDSVSFIELRVKCEEIFDMQIDDHEFSPENFQTLNKLARFIERKQISRREANAA